MATTPKNELTGDLDSHASYDREDSALISDILNTIEDDNNKVDEETFATSLSVAVLDKNVVIKHPWGSIATPDHKTVFLRSKNYLDDQQKHPSQPILLPLTATECWKCNEKIDHIVRHPSTWFAQNIDPNDESIFVVIVHLQVPSIKSSFVHYHILEKGLPPNTDDKVFNSLFLKFIKSNDDFRDSRFKLIPRIVKGPIMVRKAVENRPVILGRQVKHQYFIGKNYIEIDSQVDHSYVASSIIRLCHRFSKELVVDMCWAIEGQSQHELPERAMLGVQLQNIDFTKTIPLPQLHISQYNDYTKSGVSSFSSPSSSKSLLSTNT